MNFKKYGYCKGCTGPETYFTICFVIFVVQGMTVAALLSRFTQLAIKFITFTFHYDLEISGNLYLYFWSVIVQTVGRYVAHVPMKISKVHADAHKKLPVFVRDTVQKKIRLFLFTDSTTSIVPTACTNS